MTTTTAEQRDRLADLLAPAQPKVLPDRPQERAPCHKQVAAVAPESAPVLGEFAAKISDFHKDRDGERFDAHAFDGAIAKIRADGRPVPVLFGHDSRTLGAVLGAIPPDGFTVKPDGLYCEGWIDVSTSVGRKVFDMLRRDVLKWSIGFSATKRRRDPDGTPVIAQVGELYELSAVPVPANSRTETVALKATDTPTEDDQRRRLDPGAFGRWMTAALKAHDRDDQEHGVPSHTQLADRLSQEGIIARPLRDLADADDAGILHGLSPTNGGRRDQGEKIAAAQAKSTAAVTIASFPC